MLPSIFTFRLCPFYIQCVWLTSSSYFLVIYLCCLIAFFLIIFFIFCPSLCFIFYVICYFRFFNSFSLVFWFITQIKLPLYTCHSQTYLALTYLFINAKCLWLNAVFNSYKYGTTVTGSCRILNTRSSIILYLVTYIFSVLTLIFMWSVPTSCDAFVGPSFPDWLLKKVCTYVALNIVEANAIYRLGS